MAKSQKSKDRANGLLIMLGGAGVLMSSQHVGKKLLPYTTIIGAIFSITGAVIVIKNWE